MRVVVGRHDSFGDASVEELLEGLTLLLEHLFFDLGHVGVVQLQCEQCSHHLLPAVAAALDLDDMIAAEV